MSIFASKKALQAYAAIGGAMDNLSDSYTYVSKFLSTVDDMREPLANSSRLAKVLKYTGKAQRIYSYARKVQDLLDEKKRQGGFLKLGLKISMDIAGKLLGTSLTTHPYYAYHKAMIDALADAVNASRNAHAAIDAYRSAVTSANSQQVKEAFARIESRKVEIVSDHLAFRDRVGVAADIARGLMTAGMAQRKIAQYGGSQRLGEALSDLEAWRANWAGLSFDIIELQIMAGSELDTATEAMAKVKELINSLMGASNTNRVSGYGAIDTIEWEKYDQIVNQGKPDRSLMDPVAYAQGNWDKTMAWAAAFGEMCDFVRTDQVLFPSKFNHQLEKLNKVLYN